jgi:hypothetical protein
MDELEDVRRVIAVLQALSDRIEDMLAPRPAGANTAQLIAATTQLKADIKEAKAGADLKVRYRVRLLSSACALTPTRLDIFGGPSFAMSRRSLSIS